ncbi:hypothetical protein F444_03447 [Phytophthora nicotianae P1976]|uniref:Uncharacterized protein n=1 Tax=Phytophthora nicotianae P1976 TaxID=1317066 RepID=A0A081AU48_PHYNI|nr:hypothetical protein F444_03447 [Phytophthora nicotianae P1976]
MADEATSLQEDTPEPTEVCSRSDTQSKRKKAFLFVPSSDILLLKEAVKHRPWAAADGKACRRRFNALLDVFRRDDLESLRASGTAEDFEEREQLLTDCMALVDECLQAKADKTEKEKKGGRAA